MFLAWFGLISLLFRRLRQHHPPTYEAMGSPSLFWNNSLRNNWLFLKFLFSDKSAQLGDPTVARVSRVMRILFIVYSVVFLGLFALILLSIVTHR